MASVDVRAEDPRLRRVRSLGDIPIPPPPPSHARPSLRTLESAHNYDPHISLNTPDRSNVPSSFQMLQINPDMIAGPGGSSSTPTTQVSSGSATTAPPTPQSQQPQRTYGSRYHRTLAFFGLGRGASRARKVLFSFVWNIVWGFCQVYNSLIHFKSKRLNNSYRLWLFPPCLVCPERFSKAHRSLV